MYKIGKVYLDPDQLVARMLFFKILKEVEMTAYCIKWTLF